MTPLYLELLKFPHALKVEH